MVRLCLTCFNEATMKKLTITSNNQELNLPTWTIFHPSVWFGYSHAPKNVAIFSAIQIKNPISTKESTNGIR